MRASDPHVRLWPSAGAEPALGRYSLTLFRFEVGGKVDSLTVGHQVEEGAQHARHPRLAAEGEPLRRVDPAKLARARIAHEGQRHGLETLGLLELRRELSPPLARPLEGDGAVKLVGRDRLPRSGEIERRRRWEMRKGGVYTRERERGEGWEAALETCTCTARTSSASSSSKKPPYAAKASAGDVVMARKANWAMPPSG